MPKISVVVPVYKVEEYLPMCLDSILKQTFEDWEAVCVDDGSPDGCGKILADYATKDNRIKVITQENKGVSAARNAALQATRGDYICFLDSDDELAPDFLEKMYHALVETNADIAWCDYQQGKQKLGWIIQNRPKQSYSDVFKRFLEQNPNVGACIWNKLYKKEVLNGLQFPKETAIGEDLVFLYKAIYQSKKIVYLPEQLYFYRERKNSAMNSGLSQKVILGNIKTAELLSDFFKNKELSQKTRKILNQKITKRIFKFAVLEPKRKDKKNLAQWYALTHPLLIKLKQTGVYQPKYLTLKNRFKSWCFLKRRKSV